MSGELRPPRASEAQQGPETLRASLLRSAAFLWCVAATLVYLYVCIDTLFNPFNNGDEQLWAIPLILVSAVVIFSHFFAPPAMLKALFPTILAAAAGAIVILSGSVAALLIALLLLAAALGLGDILMRLLRIAGLDRKFERLLPSMMGGIGILGVAAVLLAALHLLTAPVVGVFLTVSAFLSFRPLSELWKATRFTSAADDEIQERPAILAIGGYMLLLNLMWAVAPEVQYDALNYHLPVAAAYGGAGELVDLLYVYSYLAGLMESFYSLAFVLGSQTAAEMIPFAIALVTTGCVYLLTERIAGRRAAVWAAFLFYSTPLIMWASSTTDVDLAIGAFIATMTICLIRWRESGQRGWLYMAAILFGSGVGVKPTIGMIAPALVAVLAHYLIFIEDKTFRSRVRTVLTVLLIAGALSAPWYLIRAHFTGNPLYPALNRYFPVHRLTHGSPDRFGGNYRIPFAPAPIAQFPFAITYSTAAYSESGATSGGIGPYLLLAIPALFMALRNRSAPLRLVSGLAITYIAFWTVLFSYARFYIPILPLVVPLAGFSVAVAARRNQQLANAMFVAIFAGQALSMPVQYWSLPERIPLRNALGLEGDEDLLRRTLPGYSAAEYLNSHAAPGDTAVGLGFERVRHYLDIPFESWRGIPEVRPVSRIRDSALLAESLHARGYDWLIIDLAEPHNQEMYLEDAFRERYGELRYQGRDHVVYRLRP